MHIMLQISHLLWDLFQSGSMGYNPLVFMPDRGISSVVEMKLHDTIVVFRTWTYQSREIEAPLLYSEHTKLAADYIDTSDTSELIALI